MNISQPPPGIAPDPHSGPVTLISSANSDITGVRQTIDLYSDGSRKVYENGKLVEEQPTYTDEEKAEGAMRPDFQAEPVPGAAADEPEHALDFEPDPFPEATVDPGMGGAPEKISEAYVPEPAPAKATTPAKKPAARKKT